MKIHWAIVFLASAGVILLTWHFRTRHLDFLSPANTSLPKEDFGHDLAAGSSALQPPIEDETPVIAPIPPPSDDELEEPEIPEITEADLGDLDASPGLATYRDYAHAHDAARLFLLSSTLRIRGEFQRALLALERIIDSVEATPEELLEAGQGVGALTSDLPRWTADPTAEIPLILEISIPYPAHENLTKAAHEIATLIKGASGGQLSLLPRINSVDNPTTLENPPIALWFSSTEDPPTISAVITVTPSGDPTTLTDELSLAAFKAVRSHLTKLDFPPPVDLESNGKEILTLQVTRLMWKEFARSLYPGPPATDSTSTDSDTEEFTEEEN